MRIKSENQVSSCVADASIIYKTAVLKLARDMSGKTLVGPIRFYFQNRNVSKCDQIEFVFFNVSLLPINFHWSIFLKPLNHRAQKNLIQPQFKLVC